MPGKYIHIGDILTCHCSAPLAKRTANSTFQIMRNHRGQKILVELTQNSGLQSIGCPECGYKYTCIGITDVIGMDDVATTMSS